MPAEQRLACDDCGALLRARWSWHCCKCEYNLCDGCALDRIARGDLVACDGYVHGTSIMPPGWLPERAA